MEDSRTLSVSQLSGYIKGVFEDEIILHNISVYGEISQLSIRSSATYFTLSEGGSSLSCVMFFSSPDLSEGLKIRAAGKVSYYAKNGRINFTVFDVKPHGQGEKYAEFIKLKNKLKDEGLFENRKTPSSYIKNLAVITSAEGAVIHDILSVLREKRTFVNIKIYASSVQGENASAALTSSMQSASADKNVDAILLARGGGSAADLEPFNNELLARAVASSSKPVISAIGHEVDYTLCDFCAGKRAGTPSIAADIIASFNQEYCNRIYFCKDKLNSLLIAKYNKNMAKVKETAARISSGIDRKRSQALLKIKTCALRAESAVKNKTASSLAVLRMLNYKNGRFMQERLKDGQTKTESLASRLEYNSPMNIIKKGYSRIFKSGFAVEDVTRIKAGDEIKIVLRGGKADAIIKSVEKSGEK